jgi:predicted RNase H-like HicB family nuclease
LPVALHHAEDGGGFLLTVPDLPGCMSDGETEAEGVSLNTLALTFIAEGLGRRERHA